MSQTIAVAAVFEAEKMRRGIDGVKRDLIGLDGNLANTDTRLGRASVTARKTGDSFKRMAGPATVALAALTVGAKRAVDSASSLKEATSKSGEIFGEQAAEIARFAKAAEQSLGQSEKAALDAASTFGIVADSAGLVGKEAAEFSEKFVTLSSDLASFNDTSPEEAVLAIGAAMRGESEPIRRYGVLLDDATLRNRALKLGLIDSVKQALTPQQKALAASEEILAQTSKAQGDFARTSKGAANQARINAAETENLNAKFGKALLPTYERGQRILSSVLGYLADHQGQTKALVAVVAALAAGVLIVNGAFIVVTAATRVYTAATKLLDLAQDESRRKMLLTRGAAAGAAGALLLLSQNGALGEGALSKVADVAGVAAAGFAVGGPWGAVIAAGGAMVTLGLKSRDSAKKQEAFRRIQQQINEQAATLRSTLDEQTGAITKNTKAQVAKNLADNGAFKVADKIGVSYGTVTKAALGNKDAQRQVAAATREYTNASYKALEGQEASGPALEKARRGYLAAKDEIKPLTTAVGEFSDELGKGKTASAQARLALAELDGKANKTGEALKRSGKNGGAGFAKGLGEGIPAAVTQGAALGTRSAARARSVGYSAMLGAGQGAGAGFAEGLRRSIRDAAARGAQIAAAATAAAKAKLDSHSPSRVWDRMGTDTGDGYTNGLTKSAAKVRRAARSLVQTATDEARRNSVLALDVSVQADRMTRQIGPARTDVAASRPNQINHVTVKVDVPVGADRVAIGREINAALGAFYAAGGSRS